MYAIASPYVGGEKSSRIMQYGAKSIRSVASSQIRQEALMTSSLTGLVGIWSALKELSQASQEICIRLVDETDKISERIVNLDKRIEQAGPLVKQMQLLLTPEYSPTLMYDYIDGSKHKVHYSINQFLFNKNTFAPKLAQQYQKCEDAPKLHLLDEDTMSFTTPLSDEMKSYVHGYSNPLYIYYLWKEQTVQGLKEQKQKEKAKRQMRRAERKKSEVQKPKREIQKITLYRDRVRDKLLIDVVATNEVNQITPIPSSPVQFDRTPTEQGMPTTDIYPRDIKRLSLESEPVRRPLPTPPMIRETQESQQKEVPRKDPFIGTPPPINTGGSVPPPPPPPLLVTGDRSDNNRVDQNAFQPVLNNVPPPPPPPMKPDTFAPPPPPPPVTFDFGSPPPPPPMIGVPPPLMDTGLTLSTKRVAHERRKSTIVSPPPPKNDFLSQIRKPHALKKVDEDQVRKEKEDFQSSVGSGNRLLDDIKKGISLKSVNERVISPPPPKKAEVVPMDVASILQLGLDKKFANIGGGDTSDEDSDSDDSDEWSM